MRDDATRPIAPPRGPLRAPRWIDLPLAAIAGALTIALLLAFGANAPTADERAPTTPAVSPTPMRTAEPTPAQTPKPDANGKGKGKSGKDDD